MVKIKKGNLLKANEDIIVHQVNVQGIMGGGVARQLATLYPGLEKEYSEFCKRNKNEYQLLKGQICIVKVKDYKLIANIFSQDENFNTDYIMFRHCLRELVYIAKEFNLKIAMPYGIGCGIANGDWNIVRKIIIEESRRSKITLYKLEDKRCKRVEVLKNKLKKLLNM
ncbi:MAG: macro domain-containing protein [Clostridia bacterium]|nr:macro domain-containing protein [Clostridia bacterium]